MILSTKELGELLGANKASEASGASKDSKERAKAPPKYQ